MCVVCESFGMHNRVGPKITVTDEHKVAIALGFKPGDEIHTECFKGVRVQNLKARKQEGLLSVARYSPPDRGRIKEAGQITVIPSVA